MKGSPSWLLVFLLAGLASPTLAQAIRRSVFVANDGNLEGSVSSFVVESDNSLTLVDRLITGSTPSTQNPVPGTNAHAISLTADGRYLAIGHTTALAVEQLTILAVDSGGFLSLVGEFDTPDTPLTVRWIASRLLAVSRTSSSGVNEIQVYEFNPGLDGRGAPSLNLVDSAVSGAFISSISTHPFEPFLYVNSSLGVNAIDLFAFDGAGALQFIETTSTGGAFPLGMSVAPNGENLYAAGGISVGGAAVLGFEISSGGGLTAHLSSPYASPGSSPAQTTISNDGAFLFAGHGSDASIHSFSIDPEDGALTSTGFSFDVGVQGSLGEVEAGGGLLFALDRDTVIDGVKGLYSFTVNGDGSLTQNGALVDTGGSRPNELAFWDPAGSPFCPGDVTGDGLVDMGDLLAALALWLGFGLEADLNADGLIDLRDLILLIDAFGPCN